MTLLDRTDVDFTYGALLRVIARAHRYRSTTHPGVSFGCVLLARPTVADGWTFAAKLTAHGCPDLPISWHRATDRVRVASPPTDFVAPGTVDYHVVGLTHGHDLSCVVTLAPVDPSSPRLPSVNIPRCPSIERAAYYQAIMAIRHAGGVVRLQPSFVTENGEERVRRIIAAVHGLAETYSRTPVKDYRGLR